MASCVYTVDEFRDFRVGCAPVDFDCFDDIDIQAAIDYASELIDRYTNRTWCPYNQSYYFNGNGLPKLFFESKTSDKLSSLVSITVKRSSCGTFEDFDISRVCVHPYYLDLGTGSGGCGGGGCGRSSGYNFWPQGCDNICVTGAWGEPVVPAGIKRAIKLLAMESLVPGSATGTSGGACSGLPSNVKQAVWPDFQVTFESTGVNSKNSTGVLEVDRILDMYTDNYSQLFQILGESPQVPSTEFCRNRHGI